MVRMLCLAAASAFALAACQVSETGNEDAAAEVEANAAADANAMPDVNATNASTATAAADGITFGPGPDSLPPGAELAVLHGNPAERGMFIIRLRFPAGYAVAPHSHPTTEYVTVISGNLGLGMGDTLDRSKAQSHGPGGYVEAPAGMNHYAFTDQGATIQITAEGPFAVTYVNPADDPRNKQPAG